MLDALSIFSKVSLGLVVVREPLGRSLSLSLVAALPIALQHGSDKRVVSYGSGSNSHAELRHC
uniref:Uncharacterized protein n=1 Tax=Arundo donax TaxID=35708 RepID=A0A0A8XWA2_ARUDO